jgi:ABC-type multidrug transport system ATPase subunit
MLEVIELSRRYGDVVALDRLSFSVEPGQLFGFVLRTGSAVKLRDAWGAARARV